MIRRRIVGSLLMLLSAPVSMATSEQIQAPLLWRVEGDVPSNLFGTIHVADPRVLAVPASVESALRTADVVYTEIPLDPSVQLAMAERTTMPDGRRLEEILDAGTIDRINRYLGGVAPGFTLATLSRLKIWALATTLPLLESQLTHPGKALDMRLYDRARDLGKETGGLETVEEQLALLDGLDRHRQFQLLETTLDHLERAHADGTDVVAELVDAYLHGDIEWLGRKMNEYLVDEHDPANPLLERFITARNRKMADRIDKLLRSDPNRRYFFAIGAGHFWGAEGLPQLLRERGYSVRRASGS